MRTARAVLRAKVVLMVAIAALLGAAACGGPPVEKPGAKKVAVQPPQALVQPGEVLQFTTVPPATSVTWSVQEAGGGTITQAGLYTAPASSGIFHVLATASPTVSGSATVTVESGVTITAPDPQQAQACAPTRLQATVAGSADAGVIFSVAPGCGVLAADGVTLTPARLVSSCQVDATAHADPAKFVRFTLQVAPERVLGVAVAPVAASLGPSGGQAFTATVTTSCGTFPAGQ